MAKTRSTERRPVEPAGQDRGGDPVLLLRRLGGWRAVHAGCAAVRWTWLVQEATSDLS